MVLPGPLGKLQSALLEGFKLRDGVGHLDLPLLTLLLQLLDLVLFTNLLVEVVLNRVLHENLQHHFLFPLLSPVANSKLIEALGLGLFHHALLPLEAP